ncbi:uncharacterized protein EV420DRAFT_1637807 [Desarmillaria tabescens]|uniref:C3H1-type domain-containing protein n=1 Tax=Armillaria tabescens TaxID=1929756 RepID=A0AA39NEZ8_ARMTA|nr:uncharacterized protein EV420DRAFT_1637807 [Desarmillaria tabescens]KAK0464243.1 hypothetical protein EV420DRAFT_1637807 [Desarmillaria tabescens]
MLPTTEKVKKPPPLKKRHTKPCKFFQIAQCPKSAEECNFAHVIGPTPVNRSSKACRYFLSGSCSNGLWCRFVHPVDPDLPSMSDKLADIKRNDNSLKTSQAAGEPPLHYPCYVASPPPFSGVYGGAPPLWSPSLPHHPDQCYPFPLPTSPISSPSDETASVEKDRDGRDYTSPIIVPVHGQTTIVSPSFAPNAFNSRHPTSTRQTSQTCSTAALKYKTKLCRYYKADRKCPNGDSCRFIHEQIGEKGPTPERPPLNNNLPPKPTSLKEENMKRGYFPVSWRVIGGGVLMGTSPNHSRSNNHGSTTVTLAYENASDVDSDKTSDVDVDETREDSDPEPLRPVPLSLDFKVRFPEWDTDLSDKEKERESPAKVAPRVRAISIPATPTMAHIQTHFSAES